MADIFNRLYSRILSIKTKVNWFGSIRIYPPKQEKCINANRSKSFLKKKLTDLSRYHVPYYNTTSTYRDRTVITYKTIQLREKSGIEPPDSSKLHYHLENRVVVVVEAIDGKLHAPLENLQSRKAILGRRTYRKGVCSRFSGWNNRRWEPACASAQRQGEGNREYQ